jgi:hypothetical protein
MTWLKRFWPLSKQMTILRKIRRKCIGSRILSLCLLMTQANKKETPLDLKSPQNRHPRVTLVELSSILSKRSSIRESRAMQVIAGQFNLQLPINA